MVLSGAERYNVLVMVGILCARSSVHQMEVFAWHFITVKLYIYFFPVFLPRLFCCYIYFSAIHKIPID